MRGRMDRAGTVHWTSGVGRRGFLFALPTVFAAPLALAQADRTLITARRLNNVMIAVSDLGRSVEFYRKLFGTPVQQRGIAIFRVGKGLQFFALTQAVSGAKADYLSYGLTVDDFDAERLSIVLAGLGVKDVRVTDRDGTAELFLRDPNGVTIQLQNIRYGHGTGPLGDVLPPPPRDMGAPAFSIQGINHVTLTPNQGAKSLEFYQRIFGLPVKSRQGTTVLLEIGTGPESIAFNTALNDLSAPAAINHACFTIRNFDPKRVMSVLIDNGLEPIEFGNPVLIKPITCRVRLRQRAAGGGGPTSPLGTPELYFNDPDNLAIQLQDVSYCGGSGWLGEICP